MMRPFDINDFITDESRPPPELIKKPKQKKKQKGYYSYYKWWLSCQTVEFWMMADCSKPFERSYLQ